MSVYVDNMEASFGRMVMCHMMADTHDELIAMADKIGVLRKWIQKPNTNREHFDICKAKRSLAVLHGAVEITSQEMVKKMGLVMTPFECEVCRRGPKNGTTLYRANEKGIKGKWRCELHLNEAAFNVAMDPAISSIENALNGSQLVPEVTQ